MHASPFAFCHASPDMLDQINDKSSEVFISKSGKNTIHRLLFTNYCSLITVHRLLFTFTVHDTVHSEILPI